MIGFTSFSISFAIFRLKLSWNCINFMFIFNSLISQKKPNIQNPLTRNKSFKKINNL